jgi:uncharacterized protein (TIGR00369 family)
MAKDRRTEADIYAQLLDIRSVTPDNCEADSLPDYMLAEAEHHIGDRLRASIHGGVLAGFLETVAQLHLRHIVDATTTTVDFTTEFLREAVGVDITARATVVRRGRRFIAVRVEAWHGDPDRPVAIGHGTFLVEPS